MDLETSGAALAWLLAIFAAAWGWGRVVMRGCGLEEKDGIVYPAALGLAALAACGGWLNLLGIAFPPLLWALLGVGWMVAAWRARHAGVARWRLSVRDPLVVPGSLIFLIAAFLAMWLLPSGAFNPADDFQLYFPRPVRMLQIGTLGGNPFELLGMDSLGTHAFLQAFVLLALPVRFFNGFDAVLCAALALGLVAAAGQQLRLHRPVVTGAVAALAITPALQVNVSSAYSGTAFILALVPGAIHLLEAGARSSGAGWRAAAPLGLLLAAFAGSKATSVSFLVPAAAIFFVLVAGSEGWRTALRSALAVAAWSGIFISPWLALHAQNYANWLRRGLLEPAEASGATAFFADIKLGLAGTVLQYDALAAFVLAAAGVGAYCLVRERARTLRYPVIALIAVCGAAGAALVFNTAVVADVHHAMRYSLPAMLAGIPAATLLLGWVLPRTTASIVAVAIPCAIAVLMADMVRFRVSNVIEFRSALVHPAEDMPQYRAITDWGFSREAADWTRRAQAHTLAGEGVVVFIAFPHHLLFARNRVFLTTEFGWTAPWLRLPARPDAERLRRFLREHGARYLIWQFGAGMKPDAHLELQLESAVSPQRLAGRTLLDLRRAVRDLASQGGVIYAEQELIVIDLDSR